MYMAFSSTIHMRAGYSRIAILLDKLRLTPRIRVRLRMRKPLIAHAAIGSQEEHGCSKERAL
jgi:hypothetical protein